MFVCLFHQPQTLLLKSDAISKLNHDNCLLVLILFLALDNKENVIQSNSHFPYLTKFFQQTTDFDSFQAFEKSNLYLSDFLFATM